MHHKTIRRIFTIAALVFAAWPVSGWSSAPDKVDFNAAKGASIKTIALLQLGPPHRFTVENTSTGVAVASGLGGLLPAMLEGGAMGARNASQSKQYVEVLNGKKIPLATPLVEAVERELRQQGYEVVYLANKLPKLMDDKKTLDYSNIQTDADAILHLYYGPIGYSSPILKNDYTPWVVLAVKLLDARTKETLYFKTYNLTALADRSTNPNYEAMLPDEKYKYPTFDDLMAKFDESVEGLMNSQDKIAVRIGQQLKKN